MSVSAIGSELYTKAIGLKRYADRGALSFYLHRRALLRDIAEIERLADTLRQVLTIEHYSQKYYDAVEYMAQQLERCRQLASDGSRDCRRNLIRLHNLPRVFLSAKNPARITPEEAMKYIL